MNSRQKEGCSVLVTGGAGFIGVNLVCFLLDRGYEVGILDNLSVGRKESLEGLPISFIEGDILDKALVRKVLAGYRNVIHLAAQTGVPKPSA